ncbi:isoprenoid synthase domain-containing protein [Abortiporus biennis]|nr:isoprenoid synthase domain-containing protein [Abortiporus biennis]
MSEDSSFQLPDIPALFSPSFELDTNRHCRTVTGNLQEWSRNVQFLNQAERDSLPGLQLGLLSSLIYPSCDYTQLFVATKFLVLLIHWIDVAHHLPYDEVFDEIWSALCRETSPEWQNKFRQDLASFRTNRDVVLQGNANSTTLEVTAYETMRKDSSGVRLLLDLLEYVEGFRFPEDVVNNPTFSEIRECALDTVSDVLDLANYNRQQAVNDNHNIIPVLISHSENVAVLERAVFVVRGRIENSLRTFEKLEKDLSSLKFGSAIMEEDIHSYIKGLRSFMVGFVHWVYETERYFGSNGEDVKILGWVFLLPKKL